MKKIIFGLVVMACVIVAIALPSKAQAGWTWDDKIATQVCGYCDGGGLPPCTLNNLNDYINGFWCNVPNYWSGPTWTYIG
jgi:hypothetical protein